MCGIAGFSGMFDASLLDKMNSSMSHRGPDDCGTFYNHQEDIGLAHRRLSIIDLSPLGRQPMWDVTKTVVIAFNGEIYNYQSLRHELMKQEYRFRSHSDTEVLLNLYLRDGTRMLDRLNGIFAFCIWDPRESVLFIARDALGVKPLYYTESGKGFLFASELKALLKEPSISRTINPSAIRFHLTYLWSPSPHTVLAAVKKLEPGHALLISQGKVKKHWRFYDLPYSQPIDKIDEQTAIRQVQKQVYLAVQRQMVADVPVGAFLSGGLDSSMVVAMAKEFTSENRLECFTIGLKEDTLETGTADDLPYAKRVADYLNVPLNIIYVGPEIADQLPKMIYHLDEPQADPAPLNALFISQLARNNGIKVLLSGAGGDDIFTGYRRHYALLQESYWGWMPKAMRSGLKTVSGCFPVSNPLCRRIRKAFQYAALETDERIVSYFYWTQPEIVKGLLSEHFPEDSCVSTDPLLSSLQALPAETNKLNRMLFLEGKFFLVDHNLNYTDKMGMASGVEVRVPLLDPDLISLAARLPVEYKQHGRVGKWIFKKAAESYLPKDVIYRPKTGFGAPLRRWLHYELRPLVEDLLSESSLKNRGLFNPTSVRRLLEMDRSKQIDATYTLFSLLCIELWCKIFIDDCFGQFQKSVSNALPIHRIPGK